MKKLKEKLKTQERQLKLLIELNSLLDKYKPITPWELTVILGAINYAYMYKNFKNGRKK